MRTLGPGEAADTSLMEGWREGAQEGGRGEKRKGGSFSRSYNATSLFPPLRWQPTPRAPLPTQRRFVALRCGTQSHENASVPESEHLLPRAGGPVHGSPARRLRARVQHPGKRALCDAMRVCIAIH